MCDKAIDTCPFILDFVPDWYKTQEMYDKAVDTCPFIFDSVPEWYKSQEMCDKAVSYDPFMVKTCLDSYKTHEMCNKAVDDFLPALQFVPDWFVINKTLQKRDNAIFDNDDIIFINEGSNNVTFFCGFDEDDPETIIYVRFLEWHKIF